MTVLGVEVSVAAFVIVILGIVNIMTTSVLERTREIGILLAMGWRNIRIIGLVLYESILLGLFGGIFYSGSGEMHKLVANNVIDAFAEAVTDSLSKEGKVILLPEENEPAGLSQAVAEYRGKLARPKEDERDAALDMIESIFLPPA